MGNVPSSGCYLRASWGSRVDDCCGFEVEGRGQPYNCTLKSECLNIHAAYPGGAAEQQVRAVGPIWRKENFTSDLMTCPTTQFMDCPGNDLPFANPFFPSSYYAGVSQMGIAETLPLPSPFLGRRSC